MSNNVQEALLDFNSNQEPSSTSEPPTGLVTELDSNQEPAHRDEVEATTSASIPPKDHIDSTAGVESAVDQIPDDPVRFFDCNICIKKAQNPILTHCGHIFCWRCFYLLPMAMVGTFCMRTCPVCNKISTNTDVTPIYGTGDDSDSTESMVDDSGILIPPRPKARRVETVRRNRLNLKRAGNSRRF